MKRYILLMIPPIISGINIAVAFSSAIIDVYTPLSSIAKFMSTQQREYMDLG
ncbi:hypothetical protein J6590_028201 [Homalodisca vitripennis]|nr:hypothetical protein J6590_028201 [Homalodisca vitripennis]